MFNFTNPISIHSPEENGFIFNNVRLGVSRLIWLGLFGSATIYSWKDGTPVTFTQWEKGFTPWTSGVAYMTSRGEWKTLSKYGPHLGYFVCKYFQKGN